MTSFKFVLFILELCLAAVFLVFNGFVWIGIILFVVVEVLGLISAYKVIKNEL